MALPHAPLPSFNHPYDVAAPTFNNLVDGPSTFTSPSTFQTPFAPNGVTMPHGNPASTAPPQWGSPRAQEVTGLSETMSELAISDCAQPPPSKIRRRNALTIQDTNLLIFQFSDADMTNMQQLPQQPDAFERSFLLQRMEELQKRLGGANLSEYSNGGAPERHFDDISPPPPSPDRSGCDDFQDFSGPVKRKIAAKKPEREIEKISLHADLQSFKRRDDFGLPDSLLRRYRSNKCNALVLYQPPVDLLAQLKERENNNVDEDTGSSSSKCSDKIDEEIVEAEMCE